MANQALNASLVMLDGAALTPKDCELRIRGFSQATASTSRPALLYVQPFEQSAPLSDTNSFITLYERSLFLMMCSVTHAPPIVSLETIAWLQATIESHHRNRNCSRGMHNGRWTSLQESIT
jgi:hypothetical protein